MMLTKERANELNIPIVNASFTEADLTDLILGTLPEVMTKADYFGHTVLVVLTKEDHESPR